MEIIKNKETFFVNIDTQFDFMDINGSLYVEGSDEIKKNLYKITNFAKDNDFIVLNTMDYHYPESEELSDNPDFIDTYPPHCIAYTDGVEFIDETSPSDPFIFSWEINYGVEELPSNRNIVIQKDKFDLSSNPNTQNVINLLKQRGMVNAIVYGVVTEICVKYAIDMLLSNGINVTLIDDANMYLSEEEYNQVLSIWEENVNFKSSKFEYSI